MAFSICYCQFIYLAHTFASSRSSYSYNPDAIFKEVLGNCVAIFILGNFIFLFFEAPLLNLVMKYSGFKRRSKNRIDEPIEDQQVAENGKCKAE